MKKIVAWVLALGCALAAFNGSQLNRVQKSLDVVAYSDLGSLCSSQVASRGMYHLPGGSLHHPAVSGHASHVHLANDWIMVYYPITGANLISDSPRYSTQERGLPATGMNQVPEAKTPLLNDFRPSMLQKDWVVTDVSLLPLADPSPLEASSICQ